MAKRFCLRGHDTDLVGRDGRSTCRECKSEKLKAHRQTKAGKIRHRAEGRRFYRRNRETIAARHKRWTAANREKQAGYERKCRQKYRGMNFWVEQAKESQ